MLREGDELLRVEMGLGGEFTLSAKPDGKGIVLNNKQGLALSYDKLKVVDATGRELESAMKVDGRRVSIEVADLEAEYPVTIDPLIDTQVAKIQAFDREASDEFGTSVSISGDTAIVGAEGEDTGGSSAGAAYIFALNCPPMISTQPVSVERDTTNSGATIAAVSDDITPAGNLSVSADSTPAGITVTNFINTNGTITADVEADCSAALGENTVTLSVMDQHGLVTMADLTVTVTAETTPPVLTCPSDITQSNDPGQCGAVVNLNVTANDNCDGEITPVCTPASGSFFPIGTTTVNCSATDAAGNSAQCSFDVTVNDTEPPVITQK